MSSNKEKTLSKKEDVVKFMTALQNAKEDVDNAKLYVRSNPVCSNCKKSQDRGVPVLCVETSDGIRCTRCRQIKQRCPRVVDYWICRIALQSGWSEAHVRGLYTLHGTGRQPGGIGARDPSQPQASGSKDSRSTAVKTSQAVDPEGSEDEDSNYEWDSDEVVVNNQESAHVLTRKKSDMKVVRPVRVPSQNGANRQEVKVADSELVRLRKESEALKHRAEMAEGNFVALIGRVQDFRMSLRSEIHTMPPGEYTNGLSTLSAAMESTIDDGGLYLRNISHALKKSRTNWEIEHGTPTEVDREKEIRVSARQVRQRSPESFDGDRRTRSRKDIR